MSRLSLKNTDDLTIMEAFNNFKDKCQIKNLSGETIKLYTNQFLTFYRFLDNEDMLISEITSTEVDDFILDLRSDNHNCNEITVNSYLRGIRAFLYYCMEMDYMTAFRIHIPKVDKKLKETYTDSELKVLFKKPNLKTCNFSEYKIWVFSNYLLGTGNRISTALNLKIEDIDFTNGLIQLNHTKNRTSQLIPLSQALSSVLKEYLKYRKGTANDYVFCNTYKLNEVERVLAAKKWQHPYCAQKYEDKNVKQVKKWIGSSRQRKCIMTEHKLVILQFCLIKAARLYQDI